jgi:hypothetical protein
MATTKNYTRPRAVDLGLSPKKTPTQAQEMGAKKAKPKIGIGSKMRSAMFAQLAKHALPAKRKPKY